MSRRLTEDEVNAVMALAGQLATKRAMRARLYNDAQVSPDDLKRLNRIVDDAETRLRSYLENLP